MFDDIVQALFLLAAASTPLVITAHLLRKRQLFVVVLGVMAVGALTGLAIAYAFGAI